MSDGRKRRPRLLGVPEASSRIALERKFEWDRDVEEVGQYCMEVSLPLRDLMRGLSVRVTPLEGQKGVTLTCEIFGEAYSVHMSSGLNRLEMRSRSHVVQSMSRLLAQLLESLAKQVRQEGVRS